MVDPRVPCWQLVYPRHRNRPNSVERCVFVGSIQLVLCAGSTPPSCLGEIFARCSYLGCRKRNTSAATGLEAPAALQQSSKQLAAGAKSGASYRCQIRSTCSESVCGASFHSRKLTFCTPTPILIILAAICQKKAQLPASAARPVAAYAPTRGDPGPKPRPLLDKEEHVRPKSSQTSPLPPASFSP